MDPKILILCFCALIFGFAFTYPLKALAPKLGFMDIPKDGRRMHTEPIPRIGGLAIYAAFVIAVCFTGDFSALMPYVFAGTIVVALGIIDDKHSLNAKIKIIGQTLAAICLCAFGVTVDTIRLFGLSIETGFMAYPLTVIFVIAVINMFNLIDGLDGLCCGLTVIAASALVLSSVFSGMSAVTVIGLIFICACFGFLPHNTHSAKIFLGDTGSMFCGLMLAALCCETVFSASYDFSALTALAALGIPVFDTSFAIVRRLYNKAGVFVGDKKHVHHRLSARYGHGKAVFFMYIGALCLGTIAIIINFAPVGEIIGAILLLLCIGYGVVRFGVVKV